MGRWLASGVVLGLFLVLGVLGCGHKPAELRQKALKAEAEARRDFENRDWEAADGAATRAEGALAQLEEQSKEKKAAATDLADCLRDARAAAGSARNYAELAQEERQCRERLATLKLKAYRQVRQTLCNYGLAGLAPAAEHFAKSGSNSLSALEQPVASLAWSLVSLIDPQPALTNGVANWAGAAADLRLWSTNPPPGLGMFLALAFSLNGLTDFALCELESVDASRLSATNARAVYHLERAALLAAHGWEKTAARELQQGLRLAPENWSGLAGTQALALVHLWQAGNCLRRQDFGQADQELTRAAEAWPNNPLTGLYAGERLAAEGQWAKAADSLDAGAAASQDAWLAKKLSQRAQQLRQTQGAAGPLFADPVFLLDCALHLIGSSAADSAAMQKLKSVVADAKALGERLAAQLPGSNAGK